MRCIKYGADCEGYDHLETSQQTQSRVLAPRNAPLKVTIPLQQQPAPSLLFEGSQDQQQYFRYFIENTAWQLSGGFDSPIFNKIVLQACYAEPSIHHMLVSIGALSKAKQSELSTDSDQALTGHHRFAFHEYGKALKEIRQVAKSKAPNTSRTFLLASMLIYCFESLQGNADSAIGHLQAAVSLGLRNRGTNNDVIYRHISPRTKAPDIEDDLVSAFARLDGQLTASLENHNAAIPTTLGMMFDYYSHPWILPQPLPDLDTAQRYLEHIQYRARPNVSYNTIVSQPAPSQREYSPALVEKVTRTVTMKEIEELKIQVKEWSEAFEPMLTFARTPAGQKDFIQATTLKIQALSTNLLLQGNLGLVPDTPTCGPSASAIIVSSLCQEILRLSKDMTSDRMFLKGFVFDYGIIPSLFTVVVSSWERESAREAIDILKSMAPRKESTWDALEMAKMGEGILKMQDMQTLQTPDLKQNLEHT